MLAELFDVPQPDNGLGPREGSCDNFPIILQGVHKEEFDHLLLYLYDA